MKIVKVHHTLVRVPFNETIEWGSGVRHGTTRLICRIETSDGVTGWGETLSLIAAVPAIFKDVVERIAPGYQLCDVERFHRHVLGAGYYHHKRAAVMAIAALEMAMWDAYAKSLGRPLYELWGGLWRKRVEAAAYVFTREPAGLRQRLRRFLDDGYTTFKIKIGFDAASDISLAENARATIGDHDMRLDVNGAWNPGTARRQLEKLRSFDPAYVEQPLELDDLGGTAHLRQAQPIPIALDESAYTLNDAGNIVKADAADYVLLDPHQSGGLWQTIKAAAICEAHGIQAGLHSGAELALSQAAYIHLAASIPNMSLAIDTERAYLSGDISMSPAFLENGAYSIPDAPGLGVYVDEAAVERYAVTAIEGAYLDPARPGWFPVKPQY